MAGSARLYHVLILLVLLAGVAIGDTVLVTENNRFDLNPERDRMVITQGIVRITHTVTDGIAPISLAGATSIPLSVVFSSGNWTSDFRAASSTNSPGIVRWLIPNINEGEYRLSAVANTAEGSVPVFDRFVTVRAVEATAGNTYVYVTNATYVTGGLISNVVEGTSNGWSAATGTLYVDTSCSSFTIGTTGQAYNTVWVIDACTVLIGTNEATSISGLTAQNIADLARSTADFQFSNLTWSATTYISRASGVFQRLVTQGPTWISVPAGLTNSGYMINLEVAATTNSITFLPDNILIATNLYTYTNRAMVFLLHNPWDEETVGVYGLKRDND